MKTLYIHIGTMKTGTTAIQTFLFRNTDFLKSNNFVYPIGVADYMQSNKKRNGSFLSFASEDDDGKVVEQELRMIDELFSKYDNVILSEETAWYHITGDRREVFEKTVQHFVDKEISVKIIVFLRRQDYFVESYWKQLVKNNKYKWSLKRCINKRAEKMRLDYYSNLIEIESIVGRGNIIVRRYQKENGKMNNTTKDFQQIVGIPVREEGEEIVKERNVNPTISNNVAEIARHLNSVPNITKEKSRRIVPALLAASEIEKNRKVQTSMFSKEESVAFVEQYKDSNDKVAERYICDGQPLFNEVYDNNEKWEKNNPYFIDDVISCFGAMMNIALDKIDEQEERIQQLEKNQSLLTKVWRRIIG